MPFFEKEKEREKERKKKSREGSELRLPDPFFQLFAWRHTPKLPPVINAREESHPRDSGN